MAFEDMASVFYNTLITDTKAIIVETLREWFKNDPVYTYREDQHGYPLLPTPAEDGTPEGGIPLPGSDQSTAIVISDSFRYEARFFPSIVVVDNGGEKQDVSFNQEFEGIQWEFEERLENGKIIPFRVPKFFIFSGIWKQNYAININTEDQPTRKRLKDILAMLVENILRHQLYTRGVFVERVSLQGESEEPYANDYIYKSGLNIALHTEWRREIPINEIVERIGVNFKFFENQLDPMEVRALRQCINANPKSAFFSKLQSEGAASEIHVGCEHARKSATFSTLAKPHKRGCDRD